jgi:hypothetical protein
MDDLRQQYYIRTPKLVCYISNIAQLKRIYNASGLFTDPDVQLVKLHSQEPDQHCSVLIFLLTAPNMVRHPKSLMVMSDTVIRIDKDSVCYLKDRYTDVIGLTRSQAIEAFSADMSRWIKLTRKPPG